MKNEIELPVSAIEDGLGFQLVISSDKPGEVVSNIDQLEQKVECLAAMFTPEKYTGDAAKAKADRAKLNASAKFIHEQRMVFQAKLKSDPRWLFHDRLAALENTLSSAADVPGKIVKEREERERSQKRYAVEGLWKKKNFTLFPLDKVFDKKWLAKKWQLADIDAEIDAIIARTYRDLKTIERFSDDAETIKAHYLISLDIAETLDYGEELQKKRQLAAKEAAEREEREHAAKLAQQAREERSESRQAERSARIADIVAEAAGDVEPEPEVGQYTIVISVTDAQLVKVKQFLTGEGIEYDCNRLKF